MPKDLFVLWCCVESKYSQQLAAAVCCALVHRTASFLPFFQPQNETGEEQLKRANRKTSCSAFQQDENRGSTEDADAPITTVFVRLAQRMLLYPFLETGNNRHHLKQHLVTGVAKMIAASLGLSNGMDLAHQIMKGNI